MTIPSFRNKRTISQNKHGLATPRILILDVRDKKTPNGETIAYVIVEREETYDHIDHQQIHKASIRLTYEIVLPLHNQQHCQTSGTFEASYAAKHANQNGYIFMTSSNLTSGALFLDLPGYKGQRIGTYLFSQIVLWAKQWPEASVHPITLMEGQADDANRERRNHFYERYGFEFDYDTPERRTGKSRPLTASQLQVVRTWTANITETDPLDHLRKSRTDMAILVNDLKTQKVANDYLRTDLEKARKSPFLWMIDIYAARYATTLLIVSSVLLLAFSLYRS